MGCSFNKKFKNIYIVEVMGSMWTATVLALPYVLALSMASLTASTLALVPSLWRAEGRPGTGRRVWHRGGR
jgi:hypothetical protein